MRIETTRDQDGWTMQVRRVADTRLPLMTTMAGLLASLNGTMGVRGRVHMMCLACGLLLLLVGGVLAWVRRAEIQVGLDEVRGRRPGLFGMKRVRVGRAEVQGVSVIDGAVALVMRSAGDSVPLLTRVRPDDGAKILEILGESGSWLGERVMAPGLSLRS